MSFRNDVFFFLSAIAFNMNQNAKDIEAIKERNDIISGYEKLIIEKYCSANKCTQTEIAKLLGIELEYRINCHNNDRKKENENYINNNKHYKKYYTPVK